MDGKLILQLVLFLIQLYMAFSLNSFVSLDVFLPAIFLYFISNLGAFIEKIWSCPCQTQKAERYLSYAGVIICSLVVYAYIAESLHFIEFSYHNPNNNDILLQSIDNTFLTFPSINVTPVLIGFVIFITLIHFLYFFIPYLRMFGFTTDLFLFTFKHRFRATLVCIAISLLSASGATYYCHYKSIKAQSPYGSPQYAKYFLLALGLTFCSSFLILAYMEKRNKKKYLN